MNKTKFTDRELQQYKEDGYIVVNNLLDSEILLNLHRGIQETIERAMNLEDFSHILELEPNAPNDLVITRRIYHPFQQHEVFKNLGMYPKIL